MGLSFEKTAVLLSFVLLVAVPVSANGFNLFVDSTLNYFIDTTENVSSSSDSTVSKLSVSVQEEWNQGSFNGTSADRNDNSGTLGIGYLNGTGSESEISSNLTLNWRLDRSIPGSGGNVKDYSGAGNTGTTVGSVDTGSEGIFGTNGFSFDGTDDKIGSSYTGFGEPGQSFTVSGWLKSSSTVSGSNYAFLTNYPGDSSKDGFWMIGTDDASSGMFFWMRNQDQSVTKKTAKYDVFNGEWHHIVGVRDTENDEMRFYIDGELKENLKFPGDKAVTDSGGKSAFSVMEHYDRYLGGRADEIQVRDRALKTSEVEKLYFQGTTGKFNGNYTRSFDTNSQQNWEELEVDANVPTDTSLDVEFRAQDSSGNTLESESFDVDNTFRNYTLSVQNSENAEVFFNGTSENASKTWTVEDFTAYSKTVSTGGKVTWNRWG